MGGKREARKPKLRVRSTWDIMAEAVERGVAYGYHRAFKHTDNPTEEQFKAAMQMALESEMAEAFDWED